MWAGAGIYDLCQMAQLIGLDTDTQDIPNQLIITISSKIIEGEVLPYGFTCETRTSYVHVIFI